MTIFIPTSNSILKYVSEYRQCSTVSTMEEIILKLLNNNVAIRGQGFIKLAEAYKKSSSMSELFRLLRFSKNPKVRQYAAVLLKKRLENAKHWVYLSEPARTEFKAIALERLMNEKIAQRNDLVDLTVIIANHELIGRSNGWPEFFECIQKLLDDDTSVNKELGISLLSFVAVKIPEALLYSSELIIGFLKKTLHSIQELNSTVVYNIILTVLHLAPRVKDHENIKSALDEALPEIICSIQALVEFDIDQSIKVIDLLDGICKSTPEAISLHTAILVTTCICIAENTLMNDPLRVKGLKIINRIVDTKNKTIRDQNLVIPIIDTIYNVLSEPIHDEPGDFFLNASTNDGTPITCAMQILDVLAQHLPPEELIPQVIRHSESMHESPDIYLKRGCFLAMSVVVEHCSEFIVEECLDTFMKYIRPSFADSGAIIRNTVQFTLSRFSKHLCGQKIDEYSEELISVLYKYLDEIESDILQNVQEIPAIDTLFFMLNEFCESFDEQNKPYLPKLADYLFNILESDITSAKLKKLAMMAFCRMHSADNEMFPYFQKLITILKDYLTKRGTESETDDLHAAVFLTLSHISQRKDNTHVLTEAEGFLKIGVELLKDSGNPILRTGIYEYVGSISHSVPELVAMVIPQIFDDIIKSVQTIKRTKKRYEQNIRNEDILTYHESEDDDDDIDLDIQQGVENPSIDEKEAAIKALGVFAETLGEGFHSYLQTSYREVFKMIDFPLLRIRKAALRTLPLFFKAFSASGKHGDKETMRRSADIFISTLLGIINKSDEDGLFISAIKTYSNILRFVNPEYVLTEENCRSATLNCIIDLLSGTSTYQNRKETQTKQDKRIIYDAGELFIRFQKVISSNECLDAFELVLMPLLRYHEKGASTEVNTSFSIEIISESLQTLGSKAAKFGSKFVPFLIESLLSLDAAVRGQSCKVISKFVRYGGENAYLYYPDILRTLLAVLSKESDDMIKDNLIASISTLIWSNYSLLPIEEVLPIIVSYLPLRKDNNEYKAVLEGVLTLIRDHHPCVNEHLQPLVELTVWILRKNLTVDHKVIPIYATEILEIVQKDYPDEWNNIEACLSTDDLTFVQQLFPADFSDGGIFV